MTRDLDNWLQSRMYRSLCPEPVQLGEYLLGLCPSPVGEVIRRHLEDCILCRGELSQLAAYLDPPGE